MTATLDSADYWLTVTVAYVAARRGLRPEQVTARTRETVAARAEVMEKADAMGYPAAVIGRYLGMHHTTVLHHLGRLARNRNDDRIER